MTKEQVTFPDGYEIFPVEVIGKGITLLPLLATFH
jgi:hypothetical protein